MSLQDQQHLIFLAKPEEHSLAERLQKLIKEIAPTTWPMYMAMLLGDQGKITMEMWQNFRHTGTTHLVAISGLHLSSLAAITFFLVFWLLKCFPWLLLRVNIWKIATLAAALPVVAYAQFAGNFMIATQRSKIMVLAGLFVIYTSRYRQVWNILALAALYLLIKNPLWIFYPSFQLSFVAVAGIIYFMTLWFGIKAEPFASGDLSPGWIAWLSRVIIQFIAVSTVASLVTAPLVAHYYQVVSFFGFLVNPVVIPLVMIIALPLGGLAVIAEALHLTSVAFIFLKLGSLPLNLGYGIIAWVAGLPGSGFSVPTPSWFQVVLIYAIIFLLLNLLPTLLKLGPTPRLFGKHCHDKNPQTVSWWQKNCWTCVGAGLVVLALISSLALTSWRTPQSCEITILDSYTGLDGVLVAPGGQRVAVTAALDHWPIKEGGIGPLPRYFHWRQFRRIDAVLALNLNARNAQEILTLAQQFEVGGFWWKGRRPVGKVVDLMNLLGDAGRPGLSLTRMRPPRNPPTSLGGMSLAYLSWDKGWGVALKITYQGRQVLILPPLRQAVVEKLPWPEGSSLAVLVAPGDVLASVVARLKPESLVCYGFRRPEPGSAKPSQPITYLTRKGAVTLTFTEQGTSFKQWTP
jgi:ComEC/Rec2-related protein